MGGSGFYYDEDSPMNQTESDRSSPEEADQFVLPFNSPVRSIVRATVAASSGPAVLLFSDEDKCG